MGDIAALYGCIYTRVQISDAKEYFYQRKNKVKTDRREPNIRIA